MPSSKYVEGHENFWGPTHIKGHRYLRPKTSKTEGYKAPRDVKSHETVQTKKNYSNHLTITGVEMGGRSLN